MRMSKTPVRQLTEYFSTPLSAVLQGSENDVNLQGAFYNVAAFLFISVGLGAAVAAYFVLEAFIKPLLWAVLCGAFLYPFKKTLSTLVCSWLRSLSDYNTPLVVGVTLLPFQILNEVSAVVGFFIFDHIWELISLTLTSFGVYLLYLYQPFYEMFIMINGMGTFLYQTLDYFSNPVWVWSIVVCYVTIVVFFWTPSYTPMITIMAYPVWSVLVLHLASIAGDFRVPLFLFLFILCIVGVSAEFIKKYKRKGPELKRDGSKLLRSLSMAAAVALNDQTGAESEDDSMEENSKSGEKTEKPQEQHVQSVDGEMKKKERPRLVKRKPVTSDNTSEKPRNMKASNIFFLALFWAIGLVCIIKNVWILELLTIPFVIYLIKALLSWIGTNSVVHEQLDNARSKLKLWAKERKDVLAPAPVRGIMRTVLLGDKKMVLWLVQFADKLISICMIMCLILGTIVFSAVIAVQVQRESMHMVQVTGDLVNDAINQYPELFKHWLPENKDFHHILQNAVDQMYLHGRDWLANKVQELGGAKDKNNSHLKKEILELTDRLYHSWKEESNASLLPSHNITSSSSNTTIQKRKSPFGLSLRGIYKWITVKQKIDLNTVFNVVKENIGVLMSIIESIWLIFKSNVNLAFNIVTVLISLVFSSGTYLLNAGFSMIVFLTALFYLLSFSQNQYLPVYWVSTLSGSEATLFGEAIYTAVRGVFGASLKMAAFYGLYTWLTHTLFGVKIVFIPSAIAAVTGVVPFVASYWAAVPAILELWLIENSDIHALLLALCHILPTYVVDTVIYSEIKGGGHPYLTGLAVAGGIYCLGLEGAIVGPIVLCCLVAAFNVHRIIMHGQETLSTPP
ncbi:transmembrane protein 245-like [Dendronephthya gigantea]|uniref:transmembrane protein 245-like n=1 Tax=Dendronephthya gigantea TaxID=151771 RepID=UPI00106DBF22|nr:transmembrane protein 245-like [Dendronephthya gigantea]